MPDYTADAFKQQCEVARALLLQKMRRAGLHASEGWRIWESLRHMEGRTEYVLRPIHSFLTAPPELECVVTISEDGSSIENDCASQ